MAVCESRGFDLYGGDNAGLVLLHGLGEVAYVTLHLLVVLVAVACLGVVGVLDAVGRDSLLVSQRDLAVIANEVLLAEYAVKESV